MPLRYAAIYIHIVTDLDIPPYGAEIGSEVAIVIGGKIVYVSFLAVSMNPDIDVGVRHASAIDHITTQVGRRG